MTNSQILLLARARRLASSGDGQRIRTGADLSLSEVADAVGVNITTLWRWEHGERSPRGEPAARWARLLDELERGIPA